MASKNRMMCMTLSLDKETLRQRMLDQRQALSPDEVASSSRRIHSLLQTMQAWQSPREVLLYAPFRNEVDTWPMFDDLRHRGVRTLLPRCRKCEPGTMEWAEASCREDLPAGRFNIPEPHPERCPPVEVMNPDLILVPGVAFDRLGFRLGYGGGYYDRFLSKASLQNGLSVGLAFDFQVLDELPRQSWDIPVDVLVTEKEVLWTRS